MTVRSQSATLDAPPLLPHMTPPSSSSPTRDAARLPCSFPSYSGFLGSSDYGGFQDPVRGGSFQDPTVATQFPRSIHWRGLLRSGGGGAAFQGAAAVTRPSSGQGHGDDSDIPHRLARFFLFSFFPFSFSLC